MRYLAIFFGALLMLPAAAQEPGDPGLLWLVSRDATGDEGLRETLARVGGPEARKFRLTLAPEARVPAGDRFLVPRSFAAANDRALAQELLEAPVLVIKGGSFMDWYETVFLKSGPTLLFRALLDRVRSKKPLIVRGGAAAFFCAGTTLPESSLRRTRRNPRYLQTQVPKSGMRLGPPALFDSDDWPEGTPLRWLHSLWQTRMDLGLYLVGDVAIEYSREGAWMRVHGPGTVILCDLGRARRFKRRLEGVRLSTLGNGDGWNFNDSRLVPAPERVARELPRPLAGEIPRLEILKASALLLGLAGEAGAGHDAPGGAGPVDAMEVRLQFESDRLTTLWHAPAGGDASLFSLPVRLEWPTALFEPAISETGAQR
jgi:hypothetical protein